MTAIGRELRQSVVVPASNQLDWSAAVQGDSPEARNAVVPLSVDLLDNVHGPTTVGRSGNITDGFDRVEVFPCHGAAIAAWLLNRDDEQDDPKDKNQRWSGRTAQ